METDFSTLFPFVIIGAFIIIAALAIFLSLYNAKKRREGLQNFALEQGLQYSPDDSEFTSHVGGLGGFELFQRGRSRRAFNILNGQRSGTSFHLFDYRYTTGSGKNRTTHYQTVALLVPQDARLVSFHVRPQHIFDKIAVSFGKQDINFEDQPEFSKKYRLMGDDEASIRSLFSPAVLEFFEQQRSLAAEANSSQLMIYSLGRQLKVEELSEFLDKAHQLANLLRRSTPSFEPYDFGINR